MSHSVPTPQIRGESAYLLPASIPLRAFSVLIDLGLAWLVFCLILVTAKIPPVPHAWMALTLPLGCFALRGFQRYFIGLTFGERVWNLRSGSGAAGEFDLLHPRLKQCNPLPSTTVGLGTFVTVLSVILGFWVGYEVLLSHPLGQSAITVEWDAFLPPLTAPGTGSATIPGEDRWSVTPFYYSLGAWPRTFAGKEVFYTLPYEKGPPVRFAGHVVARWSMPEIRVAFEGPKTPLKRDHSLFSRSEVEACITRFGGRSLASSLDCLDLREAVLERHIDELRTIKPLGWSMKWVRVTNRALRPDEQVQGIYLSAWSEKRAQDRFILVTEKGSQQAFVLSYPVSPDGTHAQELFQKAIRSLRVSDLLGPGIAWVDQELERVHLQDLQKLEGSDDFVARLAEIQSLLISRITVDPQAYDTYFHLGGTALLLARYAAKARTQPGFEKNIERITEWMSVSKPMVQNAYKYAQDVGARDPRTTQLQSYWFDAQKL